jgi:casein kinase II subunit beta
MESVNQAKELYGLIHSRFITTSKGLALLREKYLNGVYGHCPRILCDKQILLPVGLSEDMKYSRIKVYCPKCEEIYKPRQKCSEIDGAFFGSSFPHVFLLVSF